MYLRGMGSILLPTSGGLPGSAARPTLNCTNPLEALSLACFWNTAGNMVDDFKTAAAKDYDYWFGSSKKPTIAPAPAPVGDELTLPPVSGEAAQALADRIADQQMRDQQALNAAAIRDGGHWYWDLEAATANAGDAAGEAAKKGLEFGVSGLVWIAAGIAVFGLVALSAGGPRRYGR